MPKVPRKLNVQGIPFVASALATRDLPKSVFKELILELSMTHTNTGAPALTYEQACKAVSKINIVGNGQDNVVSLSMQHLYALNYYDKAVTPPSSFVTTSGAGKVSTLTLALPFGLTKAAMPEDTLFDGRGLSSLVMEVLFGSAAPMSGVAITSATLDISTLEYDFVDPKAAFARHEMTFLSQAVTVAGVNQVKLPVGGGNQYRRLWVFSKDSSGNLADGINNVDLYTRSYHWQVLDGVNVKARNRLDYGIAPLTGVYVIDLCTDGKMSERLDARTIGELNLDITTAASTGTLEVVLEKAIYA